MQTQTINGIRWGYAFMCGDSRLSEADRYALLFEATDMFLEGNDERAVKTETLDGRVYTKNSFAMIGCFGGIEYKAELDTNTGKMKVSFIISEQTQGPNSRASRN